jgi:hypothetical protein
VPRGRQIQSLNERTGRVGEGDMRHDLHEKAKAFARRQTTIRSAPEPQSDVGYITYGVLRILISIETGNVFILKY